MVINVLRIETIDRHPAQSDEASAPNSLSDTENWLKSNGDSDNPKEIQDNLEAENESDIEEENSINDPESPE